MPITRQGQERIVKTIILIGRSGHKPIARTIPINRCITKAISQQIPFTYMDSRRFCVKAIIVHCGQVRYYFEEVTEYCYWSLASENVAGGDKLFQLTSRALTQLPKQSELVDKLQYVCVVVAIPIATIC